MKRFILNSYLSIILLALYLPLFVMSVMAFTNGDSLTHFIGHGSDKWFKTFLSNKSLVSAILTSLFVAIIASVCSTIIGVFGAIGIVRCKARNQKILEGVTKIPLINSDLITAVSLLVLFLFLGFQFGLLTLVLAHISFCVPYVILMVLPSLRKIKPQLIEASHDLGASNWQTYRRIIFPILKPSIIAGAAIAFAMSFDDFIISYFTSGNINNFAVFLYSTRVVKPYIDVIGFFFMCLIGLTILVFNISYIMWHAYHQRLKLKLFYKNQLQDFEYKLYQLYQHYNQKFVWQKKLKSNNNYWQRYYLTRLHNFFSTIKQRCQFYQIHRYEKILKQLHFKINSHHLPVKSQVTQVWWIMIIMWPGQVLSYLSSKTCSILKLKWVQRVSLSVVLSVAIGLITAFYIINNTYDLTFANWSDYINPQLLDNFEKEHDVKIKYVQYSSNEVLFNKLLIAHYDLMIPSDYMVKQMVQNNMLSKINYQTLNSMNPGFYVYQPLFTAPANPDPDNLWNIDLKSAAQNFTHVPGITNPVSYEIIAQKGVQAILNPKGMTSDGQKEAAYFFNANKTATINGVLTTSMWQNDWVDPSGSWNITNYSIPYLWGDLKIAVNSHQIHNLSFLRNQNIIYHFVQTPSSLHNNRTGGYIDNSTLSWDILREATLAGKRIVLSDDARNLFMIGSEYLFQKPFPSSQKQVDQVFDYLKTWVPKSNVQLLNDEITNTMVDSDFDFSFGYNGDLIDGDSSNANLQANQKEFLMADPRKNGQGTNIWTDNLVLGKNLQNKTLAYELINYLIQHSASSSQYTFYTSPFVQTNNDLTGQNIQKPFNKEAPFYFYRRNYVPVSVQNPVTKRFTSQITNPQDGPFLITSVYNYVIQKYNELLALKTA